MKRSLLTLFLGTFSCVVLAQQTIGLYTPKQLDLPAGVTISALKSAGREGIYEIVKAFGEDERSKTTAAVAVMPLGSDVGGDYFTSQYEDAVTQHVRAARLYTRQDETMKALMNEPGFTAVYSDMVDPATLHKVSLKGVELLLVPRFEIDPADVSGARTINAGLSVYRVHTGEKIWGSQREKRIAGDITPRDLLLYGAIALAVLIGILVMRAVMRAARPR